MPRYIVAVSGGVDSVVLLDMLVKKHDVSDLVVAHFDHGIREESADDAEFVRSLAAKYGVPFETKREELGANASEELARDRRYAFLREVASKHKAVIVTAHHADDVIESISINLTRGTGWRGLAVLDSPDIERPLLDMTKAELLTYAKEHDLEWREDSTNQDTKYLRNELRQKLAVLDDEIRELLRNYRTRQVFLRKLVDNETQRIILASGRTSSLHGSPERAKTTLSEEGISVDTSPEEKQFAAGLEEHGESGILPEGSKGASPYARYLFIMSPEPAALELLRAVLVGETGISPTRPQLARALHAIKVLQAGKQFEVAAGATLVFTKTNFVVE